MTSRQKKEMLRCATHRQLMDWLYENIDLLDKEDYRDIAKELAYAIDLASEENQEHKALQYAVMGLREL